MEQHLYIWLDKKCYQLYHAVGSRWRLFYYTDRLKLNIHSAHSLDYWRRKGVLEGEEEKER